MSDERKLYRVEVTMTFYAYAANAHEAESYAQDAMNDGGMECHAIYVADAKNHRPVGEWDRECLVYHDGLGDITLGEVMDGTVEEDD